MPPNGIVEGFINIAKFGSAGRFTHVKLEGILKKWAQGAASTPWAIIFPFSVCAPPGASKQSQISSLDFVALLEFFIYKTEPTN